MRRVATLLREDCLWPQRRNHRGGKVRAVALFPSRTSGSPFSSETVARCLIRFNSIRFERGKVFTHELTIDVGEHRQTLGRACSPPTMPKVFRHDHRQAHIRIFSEFGRRYLLLSPISPRDSNLRNAPDWTRHSFGFNRGKSAILR